MSQLPVPGRDTVYVWFGRTAGDQPVATRLLRRAGGALLGRAEAEIVVGRDPGGRPVVRTGPAAGGTGGPGAGEALTDLDDVLTGVGGVLADGAGQELPVSVSHADGLVVVAARLAGPVGVDVERRRPLPAVALARRWYEPDEADWLRGRPDDRRDEDFLRLWTAKEAVGKALGSGLRDGGLRRRMPAPGGSGELLRPVPGQPGVRVGHPPVDAALVLAVAVAGAGRDVAVVLA